MPFTPLHLGPGLLLKSLGGRRLSLGAFAASQVAIDIEPLLRILRGDAVLHGWTHSYAGALLIAMLLLPVLGALWPLWRRLLLRHVPLALADEDTPPMTAPWLALLLGVISGALSHVALDGIMHADLRPFWPWSLAQPGYAAISIDRLHVGCVLAGLAGATLIGLRAGWRVWSRSRA